MATSSRRDVGLEAAARALEGLQAWDAQIGIGSFLTIDLGGTLTTPSGGRRGAFMLWIYGAAWQVLAAGEVASDSGQERGSMMAAANLLKGRRVQRAEFRGESCRGGSCSKAASS